MNLVNTVKAIEVDIIKYVMYMAMVLYAVYISIYYILGVKQLEKGVDVE